MQRKLLASLVGCALAFAGGSAANAAVSVTVDPAAAWQGFMNVFELPSNGGGFVFNSSWGTADLTATFAGSVLTLGPNSINDPNAFWYTPSGGPGAQGNKNMDANMYVQNDDTFIGENVTFSGHVDEATFVAPYTCVAFIKDFAPDFSSSVTTTVPLTATGDFSISLQTINGAGRHVQYGFETIGPDIWITDAPTVGHVVVSPVPEPATIGLAGVALLGLVTRSRRRA